MDGGHLGQQRCHSWHRGHDIAGMAGTVMRVQRPSGFGNMDCVLLRPIVLLPLGKSEAGK